MFKEEFERSLLDPNIVHNYLSLPDEDIRELFGDDYLEVVKFGSQRNPHHKYDLFEHILRTVENIDYPGLDKKNLTVLKVAAFFHDMGKPKVATFNEELGKMRFFNHPKESAVLAEPVLRKMLFPEEEIQRLLFLIRSHDDFIFLSKKEDITVESVSKILAKNIKKSDKYKPTLKDFKELIMLCRADVRAQADKVFDNDGNQIDSVEEKLEKYDLIEAVLEQALELPFSKEIERLEAEIDKVINSKKIPNDKKVDKINAIKEQIIRVHEEKTYTLNKEPANPGTNFSF